MRDKNQKPARRDKPMRAPTPGVEQAFFRDLVEQNPDLMLALDADGAIIYANQRVKQSLNYTDEELRGADFLSLLASESLEAFSALMDQAMRGEEPAELRLTLFDADNRPLIFSARLNARLVKGQTPALRLNLRRAKEALEAQNLPQTPRILVVEDDPVSARLLQRLLEQGGFQTHHAADAAQARELLNTHAYQYEAMTLDLMLPDQDGLELLAEIRGQPAGKDLPVIVVSARADSARERLTGDAANILDWLNKPLDAARLKYALTTLKGQDNHQLPRVLYVEHDPAFSREVREVLANIATLQHAQTLAEARKLLQEDAESAPFDLVLLGMNLPDGIGAELLPFLNRPRAHPVPVILVSGGETTSSLSAHVADTLTKSLSTQQQMLETIRAHLRPPQRP